jgi:predicted phosphodiesterase
MALYGVLGDIHGNKEALGAALALLQARGAEQLLCVGDVVGYNADSDECALLLRACGALSIAGNHDLIGTGRLGFERCSNKARYSLERTRRTLAPRTAEWLRAQPPTRLIEGAIALVHGGVRDVQLYMRTPQHIRANAALLREDMPTARVCFFGHSHVQKLYEVAGEGVSEMEIADGGIALKRNDPFLYFVNPGSVDAQRKREHKLAECALFDSAAWRIEFLQVPYDAAATETKAAAGGYRIDRVTDWAYTVKKRLSTFTGAQK